MGIYAQKQAKGSLTVGNCLPIHIFPHKNHILGCFWPFSPTLTTFSTQKPHITPTFTHKLHKLHTNHTLDTPYRPICTNPATPSRSSAYAVNSYCTNTAIWCLYNPHAPPQSSSPPTRVLCHILPLSCGMSYDICQLWACLMTYVIS